MHGYVLVDTARCARCAIYTPVFDLTPAANGALYCAPCGVPKHAAAGPSATQPVAQTVEEAPAVPSPRDRRVRLAVLLMVAATFVFPFAACVSSQM